MLIYLFRVDYSIVILLFFLKMMKEFKFKYEVGDSFYCEEVLVFLFLVGNKFGCIKILGVLISY